MRAPMRVILLITLLCATLAAAGEVRLTWQAPTTNEDGSALTDLAGYTVYYGQSSGVYEDAIRIGPQTTYTVTELVDGTTYYFAVSAYDASDNESDLSEEVSGVATTPVPPPYVQRVNAGGAAYTDGTGRVWSGDHAYQPGNWGFVGGKTYSTKDSISGTPDDKLYQSERYDNFAYHFDVSPGIYEVTLHFAEIYHKAPGKRIFDVSLEGVLVIDNLDIYATVGHDKPLVRTFSGIHVSDGRLSMDFRNESPSHAKVSAIEVHHVPE